MKTNSKLTKPNGFAKEVDILGLKIKKMICFGLVLVWNSRNKKFDYIHNIITHSLDISLNLNLLSPLIFSIMSLKRFILKVHWLEST